MHGFSDLSRGVKILLLLVSLVVLAEGAYLYYIQTKPSINSCQYMIAAWEEADPEAAAVKAEYTGPIANINFDSPNFPQAAQFKSAIEAAVSSGPNFAGHFVIAEWGCGSNCQDHAIVDVITGNIVAFGIPSESGLSFSRESALIMTNPHGNSPQFADVMSDSYEEKLYWFNVPREYYILSEGGGRVSVRRLCIENAFDGQF